MEEVAKRVEEKRKKELYEIGKAKLATPQDPTKWKQGMNRVKPPVSKNVNSTYTKEDFIKESQIRSANKEIEKYKNLESKSSESGPVPYYGGAPADAAPVPPAESSVVQYPIEVPSQPLTTQYGYDANGHMIPTQPQPPARPAQAPSGQPPYYPSQPGQPPENLYQYPTYPGYPGFAPQGQAQLPPGFYPPPNPGYNPYETSASTEPESLSRSRSDGMSVSKSRDSIALSLSQSRDSAYKLGRHGYRNPSPGRRHRERSYSSGSSASHHSRRKKSKRRRRRSSSSSSRSTVRNSRSRSPARRYKKRHSRGRSSSSERSRRKSSPMFGESPPRITSKKKKSKDYRPDVTTLPYHQKSVIDFPDKTKRSMVNQPLPMSLINIKQETGAIASASRDALGLRVELDFLNLSTCLIPHFWVIFEVENQLPFSLATQNYQPVDLSLGAAEQEMSIDDIRKILWEDYDPTEAYGKQFLVPVRGYFCRLCQKFYQSALEWLSKFWGRAR